MKRLFRGHLQWSTAFALRILRIPVGLSCLWWLVTRRDLKFQVTPKAGADERLRGRAPRVVWLMLLLVGLVLLYAAAGLTGLVLWHTTPGAVASAVWLLLAGGVLVMSIRADPGRGVRHLAAERPPGADPGRGDRRPASPASWSTSRSAVRPSRFPQGLLPSAGTVELTLPGRRAGPDAGGPVCVASASGRDVASLRVVEGDWAAYRTISMWLFHTPPGVVEGIPFPAPAVAALSPERHRQPRVLARQHG